MKFILIIGLLSNLCWFSQIEINSNKKAAFEVLQKKCNNCHQQKKRVVFTAGNMETWATQIHKQVFIKKRMPKGKKYPMTVEEYDILEKWLLDLNISKK